MLPAYTANCWSGRSESVSASMRLWRANIRDSEMLSERRLEEYQERLTNSVKASIGALRDHIERDARAAGDIPESALQRISSDDILECY